MTAQRKRRGRKPASLAQLKGWCETAASECLLQSIEAAGNGEVMTAVRARGKSDAFAEVARLMLAPAEPRAALKGAKT